MNIKWNKKYLTIAVYAFLVIAAGILFFRITEGASIDSLNPRSILRMLTPIFIGLAIAYLVNLLLVLFEKRLFTRGKLKDTKPAMRRSLSLILSYLAFFLIVGGFLVLMVPRLAESFEGLAKAVPQYVRNTSGWVSKRLAAESMDSEVINYLKDQWETFVTWVNNFVTRTLPVVGDFLVSTFTSLINFFIGFILSIYFLIRKEHYGGIVNKMLFALLPIELAERIHDVAIRMDTLMKQYIKGQLIISFILSVFFFVIMLIMGINYAFLLAFILFVTDLIPVVGPWIGSIPVILIIFIQDPVKGLWFIPIILIGQQLESSFLSPRVQGQQLGVSAFWIMVTLIVANHFFGLIGMVVGLPVFVLIYSLVRDSVNERLQRRGLSAKTDDYIHMDQKPLPIEHGSVPIRFAENREDFGE
ncbi:MAG: AI-2E family transporter [Tissierellia bacterium]|jgi:predicted PurR-regulated permease PerM|nr:AI-2E family transporter [Tissierellia bacterium]